LATTLRLRKLETGSLSPVSVTGFDRFSRKLETGRLSPVSGLSRFFGFQVSPVCPGLSPVLSPVFCRRFRTGFTGFRVSGVSGGFRFARSPLR
jgi:hypothetical protein